MVCDWMGDHVYYYGQWYFNKNTTGKLWKNKILRIIFKNNSYNDVHDIRITLCSFRVLNYCIKINKLIYIVLKSKSLLPIYYNIYNMFSVKYNRNSNRTIAKSAKRQKTHRKMDLIYVLSNHLFKSIMKIMASKTGYDSIRVWYSASGFLRSTVYTVVQ